MSESPKSSKVVLKKGSAATTAVPNVTTPKTTAEKPSKVVLTKGTPATTAVPKSAIPKKAATPKKTVATKKTGARGARPTAGTGTSKLAASMQKKMSSKRAANAPRATNSQMALHHHLKEVGEDGLTNRERIHLQTKQQAKDITKKFIIPICAFIIILVVVVLVVKGGGNNNDANQPIDQMRYQNSLTEDFRALFNIVQNLKSEGATGWEKEANKKFADFKKRNAKRVTESFMKNYNKKYSSDMRKYWKDRYNVIFPY